MQSNTEFSKNKIKLEINQIMHTRELEFKNRCLDIEKEKIFMMERMKSEILKVKVEISSAFIQIIDVRFENLMDKRSL